MIYYFQFQSELNGPWQDSRREFNTAAEAAEAAGVFLGKASVYMTGVAVRVLSGKVF